MLKTEFIIATKAFTDPPEEWKCEVFFVPLDGIGFEETVWLSDNGFAWIPPSDFYTTDNRGLWIKWISRN